MKQDDIFLPLDFGAVCKARHSCRTFNGKDLSEKQLLSIRAYLSSAASPFGGDVRLKLIDIRDTDPDMTAEKCTYHVISGTHRFLTAEADEEAGYALVQIGYAVERAVLFLTALGIGSCIMGGTFDKTFFRSAAQPADRAMLPCVVAIGREAEKKKFTDTALKLLARGGKKRAFEDLFYDGNFETPLTANRAGAYAKLFEAVRLAPSAMNHQPCRILLEDNKAHFYKDCSRVSHGEFDMAEIDMGIAMAHFALAAADKGFSGEFFTEESRCTEEYEDLDYVATFEFKQKRAFVPEESR